MEPENRLVARTLEHDWEEKLRTVEKAEQEYQLWLQQNRLELTSADRQDILALAEDRPLSGTRPQRPTLTVNRLVVVTW